MIALFLSLILFTPKSSEFLVNDLVVVRPKAIHFTFQSFYPVNIVWHTTNVNYFKPTATFSYQTHPVRLSDCSGWMPLTILTNQYYFDVPVNNGAEMFQVQAVDYETGKTSRLF